MSIKTRIMIVGLGLVGRRHADAIRQVPGVKLAGVAEPSDSGRTYALECGVECADDLHSGFEKFKPDGVILSTPTPLHVEQAEFCVERDCPVLIEKPLATTATEAEELIAGAERRNVPVLVGHHRRYNPLIQKARALIDEGAVGQIRSVHGQCWLYKPDHYYEEAPWRTKIGAGPLSVNLVHDIDLLRYLCGEITNVSAQMAPSSRGFENEEVAAAVLGFENSAVGTVSVSDGIVSPWSWELTAREYPVYPSTQQSCYLIGGSNGSLSVPDLTLWNQKELGDGKGDWWAPINAMSVHRDASDPLINQIAHFVAVIKHKEQPLVSGVEGLKTMRVLEAISESARAGTMVAV